jgi:CheY-like chemotaxis protein/HPt (histidine-containing phosphotransfer) domain-containing protein
LPLGSERDIDGPASSSKVRENLPRHPARLSILCGEDNATNQTIARILVEGMGHRIDLVDNGQRVVDALSAQRYDAVFMDARMPVMDGYGATGRIRDRESTVLDHDVYIIALTANASKSDRDRCLAAGMNDYVRKPIDEACLHAALARTIDYQRARGVMLAPMPDPSEDPPSLATSDKGESAPEGSEADLLGFQEEADQAQPAPDDVTSQFSPDDLREIAAQYLQDVPERIREMKAALKARDTEVLSRAAHTLKSSSAYVGATRVGRLGAKMEQMADRGELEAMGYWITRMEADFERVRAQLLAPDDPTAAGRENA